MTRRRPPLTVLVAAHVKAQPRKSAVLGVLFVVMLGLYARMYIRSWTPASAAAGQTVSTENMAADPARRSLSRPQRVTVSMPEYRELARDPFRIDLSRYPVHRAQNENGSGSEASTAAIDAVGAGARRLTLQSIVWQADGNAVACIAGRMVQAGDQVEGFTVRAVEPTRVLLERNGLRLALTWQ